MPCSSYCQKQTLAMKQQSPRCSRAPVERSSLPHIFHRNPQLTGSFALLQKMLQEGEFERGFAVNMEPRREEPRGWKKKYFEDYWGEKLKSETKRAFEVELESTPRFSFVAAQRMAPLSLPTFHSVSPPPVAMVAAEVIATPGLPPVINPEVAPASTQAAAPPSDAESDASDPKRLRNDLIDRTQYETGYRSPTL